MEEARETGEHSLKRTLGVFQFTALGVGAVIGAGIFVLVGLGAHYAGPGLMFSFVLSGLGCAFAALCYAEFAAMIPLAGSAYTYAYATLGEILAWIIGWDLTLEYAMGASTVSSGLVESLHRTAQHFSYQDAAVAGLRSLDGAQDSGEDRRSPDGAGFRPSLVPGTQAFLDKVSAIMTAQSPELLQRAHDLLGAPHLFGMEIGFNLPAFIIALVITAILVIGIKESARFNATIVVHQGCGGAIRDRAWASTTSTPGNWGTDWSTLRPMDFLGSGPERPTYSLPTSVSTPFRRQRRKRRIRSGISRSE